MRAVFRSLALAIALATGLWGVASSPTAAAFSSFVSLGTGLVAPDPSCVSDQPGKAVCLTRSLASKPTFNRYDGSSWSGWTQLTGLVGSAPSCAAVGGGKVICVSKTTYLTAAALVFDGTTWSTPVVFAAVSIASGPSCAAYNTTSVVCLGRTAIGGLQWFTTDGTTASTPAGIGPNKAVIFGPRCASDNAAVTTKNVICTYVLADSTIGTRRFNGTAFSSEANLGGRASGEFPCTDLGPGVIGKVLCITTSNTSELNVNTFNGGTFKTSQWSGYNDLAGNSNYPGSCAAYAANSIVCGAIGNINSALYVNVNPASSFQGFTLLGGVTQGNPSCFTLAAGQVMCVVVNIDGTASSTVGP